MRALALLLLLAGCPTATTGTIDLGLTTEPGSTLLDAVTRLRVTLTNPRQVVEAARSDTGFSITLDVEANGEPGAIVVEGFDANENLIAGGQSPEFGIAGIDARIVVYMAPPLSIARAPVTLMPARANVTGDRLTYGAIFVGGADPTTNAPSDALAIYNAFDHSLVGGKPLLAPRSGIVVARGNNDVVFLYGGRDANGNETATFSAFDTNFPPSGAYADLGDFAGFPRADAAAFQIGVDDFIVTGSPPLEVTSSGVTPRADIGALAATAAFTISQTTGVRTAIALDSTGRIVRFRGSEVTPLEAAMRPGGSVGALPDGRFIVVGGGTTVDEQKAIFVVDPVTGGVTAMPGALAIPHANASIAVTRRHVVIVGSGPIEILDATTLASLETRTAIDGRAFALPNDQVIIVDRANGDLSLFTPPPPAL